MARFESDSSNSEIASQHMEKPVEQALEPSSETVDRSEARNSIMGKVQKYGRVGLITFSVFFGAAVAERAQSQDTLEPAKKPVPEAGKKTSPERKTLELSDLPEEERLLALSLEPKIGKDRVEMLINKTSPVDEEQRRKWIKEDYEAKEKAPLFNEEDFKDYSGLRQRLLLAVVAMPKSYQNNIHHFQYKNSRSYIQAEYGLSAGAEKVADFNPNTDVVTFYKTARAYPDSDAENAHHETGHGSDMDSNNYLTIRDRLHMMHMLMQILEKGDTGYGYVDKIKNPNKQLENWNKATELWACLHADYFDDEKRKLMSADRKAAIEFVLGKTDPEFNIEQMGSWEKFSERIEILNLSASEKKMVEELFPKVGAKELAFILTAPAVKSASEREAVIKQAAVDRTIVNLVEGDGKMPKVKQFLEQYIKEHGEEFPGISQLVIDESLVNKSYAEQNPDKSWRLVMNFKSVFREFEEASTPEQKSSAERLLIEFVRKAAPDFSQNPLLTREERLQFYQKLLNRYISQQGKFVLSKYDNGSYALPYSKDMSAEELANGARLYMKATLEAADGYQSMKDEEKQLLDFYLKASGQRLPQPAFLNRFKLSSGEGKSVNYLLASAASADDRLIESQLAAPAAISPEQLASSRQAERKDRELHPLALKGFESHPEIAEALTEHLKSMPPDFLLGINTVYLLPNSSRVDPSIRINRSAKTFEVTASWFDTVTENAHDTKDATILAREILRVAKSGYFESMDWGTREDRLKFLEEIHKILAPGMEKAENRYVSVGETYKLFLSILSSYTDIQALPEDMQKALKTAYVYLGQSLPERIK